MVHLPSCGDERNVTLICRVCQDSSERFRPLWWPTHGVVVAYNLSDQLRLVSVAKRRADLLRWQAIGFLGKFEEAAKGAVHALTVKLQASTLLSLALAATGIAVLVRLRKGPFGWRFRRRGGRGAVLFYRELLGVLARKGFVKESGLTPREFAATVEANGWPELAEVSWVVEIYYRVRYGGRHLSGSERRQIDRTIRRLAVARKLPSAPPARTTIPSFTPRTGDHR